MAKRPHDEPRRVESPARMAVAEEVAAAQEPVMRVAETADREVVHITYPKREDDPITIVNVTAHEMMNGPLGIYEAHTESTPVPHNPMGTVPRDGTMVNLIREDGSEVRVVWRSTRRYNAREQQWEPTGFWSSPMNRVPVEVDAIGWRLGDGFLDLGSLAGPGMVVA